MDKPETGNDTSSTSTQEPGEGREAEGDAVESLDEPLAEEHVHTQEQRNQAWTQGGGDDPRQRQGEAMSGQASTDPAPTLDMPSDLEDKLDDVMAHPHSDAQKGEGGTSGQGGGMPKTGSGD